MLTRIYETVSQYIVTPVYADALGNIITREVTKASQSNDLEGLVQSIINLSIPAGVLFAVLLLTYAGYLMISSQGNPEKLNEAREVVTNAIIGFAMVIMAVAILMLIQDTLQLPLT
jgi:hypothetical protein